jgi:hypothetical protein
MKYEKLRYRLRKSSVVFLLIKEIIFSSFVNILQELFFSNSEYLFLAIIPYMKFVIMTGKNLK